MKNRLFLITVTTAALTLLEPKLSLAQTVSYDFTVDILSGPLSGERYTGITSVDVTNLPGDNSESVKSTSITFDFGGVQFTEADDAKDTEADSPRANFQGGEFLGNTYFVSSFGENATEIPLVKNVVVEGFAIENNQFGYLVEANLYGGVVNYSLPSGVNEPPGPPAQSVPEPSLWVGLATLGCTVSCGRWLTHREASA